MIIMPVKEGENIERALKKFKRKYERTGVLKELRARQYFTKPSIAKRDKMAHAIYVEQSLHRSSGKASKLKNSFLNIKKGIDLLVDSFFVQCRLGDYSSSRRCNCST